MNCTNGFIKIISVLLILALLAGCTPSAPQVSSPTLPEETTTPEKRGGTLTIPLEVTSQNLNPLLVSSREMLSISGLIFEGLMTFNESGMPMGSLAESWETEDGIRWTFKLRPNATWHTGRALDAYDVVFTLDLLRNLAENSIYSYVFDVVDSYTVNTNQLVITTKTPFYGLLQALTFPILPRDVGYSATAAPRIPVGTGIFKVDNYTPGKLMELSANPDWWRQQGLITNIRAIPMGDTDEALSGLVYGQLDALLTDKLSVSQYSSVGASTNVEYSTRYLEYLMINQRNPYLKDTALRKALCYAINKSEVASYVYVNHGIVVDTPVTPDSWLYSGRNLTYEQDTDKARMLIAQCGWKDQDEDGLWDLAPDNYSRNLSFKLIVSTSESSSLRRDTANLLKTQLKEAGIQLNIVQLGYEEYQQALENGQFDLALCGTYLSPLQDFTALCGTDGAMNYGSYSSAALDQALNAVLHSPTKDEMQASVDRVQNLLIEELPFIPLLFRTHTLLTSTEIKGVGPVREENGLVSVNQWYIYR